MFSIKYIVIIWIGCCAWSMERHLGLRNKCFGCHFLKTRRLGTLRVHVTTKRTKQAQWHDLEGE